MKKLIIISTGAALCLVVAFFILRETSVYNFVKMGWEHRTLDNARAKWEEHGYTSYVMEVNAVTNHCLFDLNRTYSVLVIDNRVISTHLTDDPETERGVTYCHGRTVIDIFRKIDRAVSDLDSVWVKYDEELGFPTEFSTDKKVGADSEFRWEVFRLTPDLDTYADLQKREELIAGSGR